MEGTATRRSNSGKQRHGVRADPAVAAAFEAHPKSIKSKLLALRSLIFDTARSTEGVGALEETLKWGQVSYLTSASKSGSTIRIDRVKSADQVAVFFP